MSGSRTALPGFPDRFRCRRRWVPAALLAALLAGCGPSEEEIAAAMTDLAKVMATIDYDVFDRRFEPHKVDYLDLRNAAGFGPSVGLAIRLTQHDGPALDPREFASKRQALLWPEDLVRDTLCPPAAVMPRYADFVVMLTIYSIRYDRRYGIECPQPEPPPKNHPPETSAEKPPQGN